MHDLDHELGDLNTLASDLELELGTKLSVDWPLSCAVQGLQRTLEASEPSIISTVHALAELDWCVARAFGNDAHSLLSLALAAQQYDWQKPTITESSECFIADARHPLVELTVQSFVPNDCHLERPRLGRSTVKSEGSESSSEGTMLRSDRSMLVTTGANGGGKSVYLKCELMLFKEVDLAAVAIIVLLAHIGSFVASLCPG